MAAEPAARRIGLIIVGDEILSGRRQDKHFSKVVELLAARGMQLGWAEFLPDDRDALTAAYRRSFASGDVVLSCGGIGGTPDDHTRQAAAAAGPAAGAASRSGGSHCAAHRRDGGQGQGTADMSTPENQQRLQMGVFPQGCEIVPNPYNRIPGFFIRDHVRSGLSRHGLAHARMDAGHALSCNAASAQPCRAFLPGFPHAGVSHHAGDADRRIALAGCTGVQPAQRGRGGAPHIDLGVKGEPEAAAQAWLSSGPRSCGWAASWSRRPRPELDEGLNKRGDPFIQFKTHCQMPR